MNINPDIVHDLLIEPIPTLELCARHKLTLPDLLGMLQSEDFQSLVADLATIEQLRTAALAPIRREQAIATLQHIAAQEPTSPTHAETVRKAAAFILRITKQPPDPTNPDDPCQATQPQQITSPATTANQSPAPINQPGADDPQSRPPHDHPPAPAQPRPADPPPPVSNPAPPESRRNGSHAP